MDVLSEDHQADVYFAKHEVTKGIPIPPQTGCSSFKELSQPVRVRCLNQEHISQTHFSDSCSLRLFLNVI